MHHTLAGGHIVDQFDVCKMRFAERVRRFRQQTIFVLYGVNWRKALLRGSHGAPWVPSAELSEEKQVRVRVF
jgi:hypothetical protein